MYVYVLNSLGKQKEDNKEREMINNNISYKFYYTSLFV